MGKAEIKIDTTEAMKGLEELKTLTEKATSALKVLAKASCDATEAMDRCSIAMAAFDAGRTHE